ncbi:transglycosylase family protein [Kitasatospora sp. HPMI-4]|uniref:transglycosylase family protein n=1 Tax=Kitasatospora sp. HPMI-4 TaxID=3448443 RepID=UPI003F1A362A
MVFSGSGRHRRPTQADRAIAAAGVASVGLALPLLTATGAHATPATTWDAVAQCETGGNWTADDGNGHYGGLGLTQRTWVTHGGDKYAAQPDHATRSQQIAVAERVLAESGSGLWANCASSAGLTGGSTTGATPTPAPSATSTPAPAPDAPAATPTPSTPSADTGGSTPGTPDPTFPGRAGYDPNAGVYWFQDNGVWHWTVQHDVYIQHMNAAAAADAPSGAPSADPGTGTAPATPSPAAPGTAQPSPSAQADGPSAGASTPAAQAPGTPAATGTPQAPAAPVAGAGATTAPATPGSPAAPGTPSAPGAPAAPAAPATTTPQTYTVEHGDTLSAIARSHQIDGWQHLYESNKGTIGDNPDLILPGQALNLQQR